MYESLIHKVPTGKIRKSAIYNKRSDVIKTKSWQVKKVFLLNKFGFVKFKSARKIIA